MVALTFRSRLLLVLAGCVLIYLVVHFNKRLPDSYSAEEINSMFQDKESSTVHVRKVELKDQALAAPYIDQSTLRSPNWNMAGNFLITNDAVRLVSDKQHQAANMFTKMPIQAQSFEMELTFNIHSKSSRNLYADGMAVWFIDEPSPIGDVFGARNYFNGLGIFLDTYRNGKQSSFPHVVAMVGDGRTRYDKLTDGFDTMLASCRATKAVNPDFGSVRMRIIYLKGGYLSVDLNYQPEDESRWRNCFTVPEVKLPVVKYLGVSAETGELSHAVDVIENKVFALYHPESNEFVESMEDFERMMQQQQDEKEEKADSSPQGKRRQRRKNKVERKSVRRLKAAEKRIKEQERALRKEKYGDPDATLPVRIKRGIVSFLKMLLYLLFIVLAIWVAYIVHRTRKQTRRSKATGLLD
uniref:L-type lectin-like domain-containing protein n=1 Tax=Candidozyma auris TaxID=498019 RepID=A0A0L0P5Q2_CANAR